MSLEDIKNKKNKGPPKINSQNLRTGKNPKLFNKLESIQNINRIQPLIDGGKDLKLGSFEGSVWGKGKKQKNVQMESSEVDDKQ